MSREIKLNCNTCAEIGFNGTHYICKAAFYNRLGDGSDPAGEWALKNQGLHDEMCMDFADDCPCYRIRKDAIMGSFFDLDSDVRKQYNKHRITWQCNNGKGEQK